MASKRRLRRRNCERKVRYRSAHIAGIVVRKLKRKGKSHGEPYHCRLCTGWHIGHRPGSGRAKFIQTGVLISHSHQ